MTGGREPIPLFDAIAAKAKAKPTAANGAALAGLITSVKESDDALALEFATENPDLLYVADTGKWFVWTGKVWERDRRMEVYTRARAICRRAAGDCDSEPRSRALVAAKTVNAVLALARSDPRLAELADAFDGDEWLLNTPAGVVDLRTGAMMPHDQKLLQTKITSVESGGDCPIFLGFLDRITAGDRDLQGFIQRVLGYGLTGSIREHGLFFFHGHGGNGKGTLITAVTEILSGYLTTSPMEVFTETRNTAHLTELANLQGARTVIADEVEAGKRWAESRIKLLTGGNRISARFMRQDLFEFDPQFTLIISGNNKPAFANVDPAIRRRLYLVPFAVKIPPQEVDRHLSEKLRAEYGGILGWLITGAVEWAANGLQPPEAVRAATEAYLAEEDSLSLWLEECCEVASDFREPSGDLFKSWVHFAEAAQDDPGQQKAFAQKLAAKGFQSGRSQKVRCFFGLRLRREPAPNAPYFDE